MCLQSVYCALSVVPDISTRPFVANVLIELMPHLVKFRAIYCLPVLCASSVTAETVKY